MLNAGTFLAKRYQILEKIGSGGMADVYKAKDIKLSRFVAVKVMKEEFALNETFVKKFNAEAQSAAGLSNPNIVGVYDVGKDNGINFIVMELIQGITLKNYIKTKGRLEAKEALNISVQVASGLSAAHESKIIHRDIKPQNIILSRDGKAKITDFGIAKMADSETKSTNAAGSVHYISPEQARGVYSDARSDIYSLGITMYEMVTGKVPFEGDTNVTVALSHIHDKPAAPKELAPDIPESLNKIILKCIEKKPDFRYQSAKELIADLRKALTNPGGEYVLMGAAAMTGAAASTVVMTDTEASQLKASSDETVVMAPVEEKRETPERRHENRRPSRDTAYLRTDDDDDDEEEEDDVNPGMRKIMVLLGVIGIAVICCIIVFILVKMTSCSGSNGNKTAVESVESTDTETTEESKEQVKVPDFKNMKYEDAINLAKQQGLEVKLEERFDDDIEEGRICDQNIKKNEMADKDSEIILYVSKGEDPEKEAPVPDISGIDYELAKEKLKANGFNKYDPIYENSDEVDKGKVIKTDPAIGTKVKKGDTIKVYVSDGKSKVPLPNIIGESRDAAANALNSAGFVIESESSENSDSVPEGKIIRALINGKSVSNGEQFEKGSRITIVVSKGKAVKTATFTLYDSILGEAEEGKIDIRYNGASYYSGVVKASEWKAIESAPFEYVGGKVEVYLDGTLFGKFDESYYGFTYQ